MRAGCALGTLAQRIGDRSHPGGGKHHHVGILQDQEYTFRRKTAGQRLRLQFVFRVYRGHANLVAIDRLMLVLDFEQITATFCYTRLSPLKRCTGNNTPGGWAQREHTKRKRREKTTNNMSSLSYPSRRTPWPIGFRNKWYRHVSTKAAPGQHKISEATQ